MDKKKKKQEKKKLYKRTSRPPRYSAVNSAGRAAEVFVRIKNYILMPSETFST